MPVGVIGRAGHNNLEFFVKVNHRNANLNFDNVPVPVRETSSSVGKRPSWGEAVCVALLCSPMAAAARVPEARGSKRSLLQAGCGGPYPWSDPMGGSAPAFGFGDTPMALRRISTDRLWVTQKCQSTGPTFIPATSITYGFENQPGPWEQLLERLDNEDDVDVITSNVEALSHTTPNLNASSYANGLGLQIVPTYFDTPANLIFLQARNSTVVDAALPDWIGLSPGEYYQNNVSAVVKVRQTSDTVAWRAALGTALGLIGRGAAGDDGSPSQAGAFPSTTLSSLEFAANYASDAGFGPLDMQALGSKYGIFENKNEVMRLTDGGPATGAIFGSTDLQNDCYMSPVYNGSAPLQVSTKSEAGSYTHVGNTLRSMVPGTYCDNVILSQTMGGTVLGNDRDNFIQGSSYGDIFVLGSGNTVIAANGDSVGSKQVVLGQPNTYLSIQNGGTNSLYTDTFWLPLETAITPDVKYEINASGVLLTAPNNITVWAANWNQFDAQKQVRPGAPAIWQLPLLPPTWQGPTVAPAPAPLGAAPVPAVSPTQIALSTLNGALLPRGSISTAVSISDLLPPQLSSMAA